MIANTFENKMKLTRKEITLAVFSGIGLAFILIWNIYPFLGTGQEYVDLVVGNLAWTDYDKDKELRAIYLFLICTVIFALCIALLFHYLKKRSLYIDYVSAARRLFCIAWMPALFWLGGAFMASYSRKFILDIAALLVISNIVNLIIITKRHKDAGYDDVIEIGICSILIMALSLFAVAGGAVFIGKVLVESTDFSRHSLNTWIVATFSLFFLFNAVNIYFGKTVLIIKSRFYLCLLLLQVFTPLLLFRFLSQGYIHKNDIVIMHKSYLLTAVIVGLLLFAWFSVFRLYKKLRKEMASGRETAFRNIMSAAALFPVAVYLSCNQAGGYDFSIDYFHIGEQLLPWQQIVDFAKLPYVDFVPIHGLMSIAYGGLNELFYGHTVATFPLAMVLLKAIAVGLTFIAVFWFSGPLFALCIAPFAVGPLDRVYFLIPAVLILCLPNIIERSRRWLLVWAGVCFFSIFYNVAVGAGIIIGSLPVAIYMGWKTYREHRIWFWGLLISLIVIGLIVIIVSPIRQITFGFLRFIMDNTATYTIANSIGMFQYNLLPKGIGFAANQFQWTLLRLSWLVVAFASAVLFLSTFTNNRVKNPRFYLLAILPLTLLMVGQWALGRVDVSDLSRTCMLSYTAVIGFVPLIIMDFGSEDAKANRLLFLAFLVGAAVSMGNISQYDSWRMNPLGNRVIPDNNILVSGEDIELSRIGEGFVDPKRLGEIKALRQTIANFLKTGETFLDLTNSSALYFYLDKPSPVLYSGDYVAANSNSLGRMLDQIKKDPPPIVLVSPRFSADGGPASLRSYILYRYFIDTYVPKQIGNFIFLVRPDRAGQSDKSDIEKQLAVLDKVFRAPNLGSIPDAWGRSWDILKSRFKVVHILNMQPTRLYNFETTQHGSYKPVGKDPRIYYDVSPYNLEGKDIDHILIEYSCIDKIIPKPVLEIYWATENDSLSEKTVVRFFATGNRALIPIGAQPRWRLGKKIKILGVGLSEYKSCSKLRVDRIVMLKLKDQAN